jgi:hypothetical protein
MQTRLTTLADVRPVPMPPRNARGAIKRWRNATAAGGPAVKPIEQQTLSDFIKTLLRAYGWRPDFHSVELPRRIPYVPLPFAGLMVEHFANAASVWLLRGAPSLQPNFIKNRVSEARYIVGEIRPGGEVVRPNEASYEQAPPMVALKAPLAPLPSAIPGVMPPAATRPHGKVLTAPATWKLLDVLGRLARHLDVLADAPSLDDVWNDSWEEAKQDALDSAAKVAEKTYEKGGQVLAAIPDGLSKLAHLPDHLFDGLKTAALVAGGLAVLYLVLK